MGEEIILRAVRVGKKSHNFDKILWYNILIPVEGYLIYRPVN